MKISGTMPILDLERATNKNQHPFGDHAKLFLGEFICHRQKSDPIFQIFSDKFANHLPIKGPHFPIIINPVNNGLCPNVISQKIYICHNGKVTSRCNNIIHG